MLAFLKGRSDTKIFCADGNAGIAEIAECVNIKPSEIARLADFAVENEIDLTFVGGETPLALGIVDEFEKRNLKIIGASKKAAQLEASKSFAKDFMARHRIPTANYEIAGSAAKACEILRSGNFGDENSPVVVKADGLAAGKASSSPPTGMKPIEAIDELENIVGKEAVSQIVLEECLFGREVSLILFADGKNFALMPPARDHKRIGENDTGANTGGMGVDHRRASFVRRANAGNCRESYRADFAGLSGGRFSVSRNFVSGFDDDRERRESSGI